MRKKKLLRSYLHKLNINCYPLGFQLLYTLSLTRNNVKKKIKSVFIYTYNFHTNFADILILKRYTFLFCFYIQNRNNSSKMVKFIKGGILGFQDNFVVGCA